MAKKSILITGSRGSCNKAKKKAIRVVLWLMKRNVKIIVGDAEDIDEVVIKVANLKKYTDIDVYGAYGRMRRFTVYGTNIPMYGTYPARDYVMAKKCTGCISFWDGRSRGTKITFDAANKLGKPVKHLWKSPED